MVPQVKASNSKLVLTKRNNNDSSFFFLVVIEVEYLHLRLRLTIYVRDRANPKNFEAQNNKKKIETFHLISIKKNLMLGFELQK